MFRNILTYLLCSVWSVTSFAQFASLEVEPYYVHAGPTPDGVDLTGFTTYRIYVHLTNQTDFCSSVYGDSDFPLSIATTTSFWHSPFGGLTGPDSNPILFPTFPSLEYDSFVTIGRANSGDPGSAINTVQSDCDQWISAFNLGMALEMDCLFGGAWFALNGDINGLAGADLKVLIGQFTTDGVLSGTINVQVFPLGNGANEERITGLSFSSDGAAVFGCTNPVALNYNPDATQDDGSCVFPCSLSISNVEITPNLCAGLSSAEILLTTDGGQGSVRFSLNGGNYQLSPIFDDLPAGEYAIHALDGQGCIDEIVVSIDDPDPLQVTAEITQPVLCSGDTDGEIIATGSGGTGDILYGLVPGNINSVSPLFSNLSPGSYIVYCQDENNCQSQSASVFLTSPSPITATSITTTASDCGNDGNGTITITVIGGTGQKLFSLDGVNYQISGYFTGLGTGTYSVFARDANLCVVSFPATVEGPNPVSLEPIIIDNLCAQGEEGSIDLNIGGGTGEITVSFNGGNFDEVEFFENLTPGVYSFEILDAGTGCAFFVDYEVMGGPQLTFDYVATELLCADSNNGEIEISAEGGYGDLEFALEGEGFNTNNVLTNVSAGTQNVLIRDSENCIYSFEVQVLAPDEIQIIGNVFPEQGNGTGEIDIEVSGGMAPYTYLWNGPNGFAANQQDIDFLEEGTYAVTVTDANGCEQQELFNLTVGIDSQDISLEWLIYPNPAKDIVNIDISSMSNQSISLILFDSRGRTIKEINNVVSGELIKMDISKLESGIYLLILMFENTQSSRRVVKL